jgi:regulator of protease activity HflC (stomatin/prohibitin superfamily)
MENEFMADPTKKSARTRVRAWIKRRSPYLAIAILTVLFFALLLSNRIVHNIGPGERGVKWSRFFGGTVLDRIYPEGVRAILPWDLMYIYNIRVQQISDTITVLTQNGLPVRVSYSSRYYPHPDTVASLHQRYGPDYSETVLRPEVVGALREVIGNYRPEDIYARDEEGLLDEVYTVLQSNTVNHFIVLQDILIKELRLTPELENAINDKLVQEQEALAYEFRLRLEESERERKKIEAYGIRDFEAIAKIDILQWRGIEATIRLAESENAKVIVIGTGSDQLPIILGAGGN